MPRGATAPAPGDTFQTARAAVPRQRLPSVLVPTVKEMSRETLAALTPPKALLGPPAREVSPVDVGARISDQTVAESPPAYGVREGAAQDIEGFPIRLPAKGNWLQSLEVDQRPYALGQLELSLEGLPRLARGIEFYVVVLIDRDGRVVDVQPVGRDDEYSRAVAQALSRVRFSPGISGGTPVGTIMVLWFGFEATS